MAAGRRYIGLLWGLVLLLLLASGRAGAEIRTLSVAVAADPESLNPQEQTLPLFQNICLLLHDSLLNLDPAGRPQPGLLENCQPSADGLTWTLRLKPGLKFQDDAPLNAAALKLTFDRILDQSQNVPLRFALGMVKEARVTGDLTLDLKLKYPYSPLPQALTLVLASPVSPAALDRRGSDSRFQPVGAGPYRLAEWVRGERLVLTRNQGFHGRPPLVERIVWRVVPDVRVREAMLRSGQVQICHKPSPASLPSLRDDPNIAVEERFSTRTVFVGLNCQKGPTANKLIRQALNYAVNKKALVQKVLGEAGRVMDSPLSPALFGYSPLEPGYGHDPIKARLFLKKAKFDFDRALTLQAAPGRYLQDRQVLEAVQKDLRAVGVRTEVKTQDWPSFLDDLLKPIDRTVVEAFLLGWAPLFPDADLTLFGQFTCAVNPPLGLGAAFYCNPDFDKLMDRSRREMDSAQRLALLREASRLVWEDCPWIWLHVEKFFLARRSDIKGLTLTPTEMFFPTYAREE